MHKIIKIPFVGQTTGQSGTVVTLCIICVLFFTTSGCGKDSSDGDIDGDPFYDFLQYSDNGKPYDFYYTDTGKKEVLKVRKDKVIIKAESADIAKTMCNESVFMSAYDVGFWVIATINPKKTKLEHLLKMAGVVDATYGLEYIDGTLQYSKNVISVNMKNGISPEEILGTTGLTENVETIEFYDTYFNGYRITLNVRLCYILQISRNMFESGLCKVAGPSFFIEMKPH